MEGIKPQGVRILREERKSEDGRRKAGSGH